MNQLFYDIFNPMEIFFLEGFVCWRHVRAQWEYETRSRNWIWLDKFASYVIKFLKSLIPIGGYLSEDSEITIEELDGWRWCTKIYP